MLMFQGLSRDTSATTKAIAAPAFDAAEAQQDIKTGKLRFEIRGLTNEAEDKSYGVGFLGIRFGERISRGF
jgi:hypothetical protein